MPYEDPDTKFLLTFHPFNDPFNDALNKDRDVMMAIITPRAIPVNFFGSGKASNMTYEFYNPSALARQLAFGQLPIALCYADVVKPRETITSNLEWIRIAQLPPNADTDVDLSAWILLSSLLRHTNSGGKSGKSICSADQPSHIAARSTLNTRSPMIP